MHSAYSVQALIVVALLFCYIFTSHLTEIKKVPFLHQSVVAIILGAIVGGVFVLVVHKDIIFSNEIFFTFILPPIIFAAGYNLRKSLFFQNFGIISFFGVIGTIMTFVVLSSLISLFNHYIFNGLLTTPEVLMMSSVLCATDSVTALSLIKQEDFPVLNAVLFGEGIINDAVAIIIFGTISDFVFKENEKFNFLTVLLIIGDFFYLLIFSLAVGIIFGFGLSYFLKKNETFTRYPIKQTSLILLTGYVAYLVSELMGLSGIISLFTSSVIMGHYCFLNISEQSQKGTVIAFDTVGYLAQAFVFVYLGVCIFGIEGQWLAVGMASLVLVVFPLARAVSVYLLPLGYWIAKKKFPLHSGELKVCWYSGMIRGAIAFALCLQIDTPNASFIKTVTLVVVLVTTICASMLLKSFLKWIGIVYGEQGQEQLLLRDVNAALTKPQTQNIPSKYDQIGRPQQKDGSNSSKWEKFENQYIKPTFTKPERTEFSYEIQSVEKKLNCDLPL